MAARIRRINVPGVKVSVTGLAPGIARAVAADLPAAVNAAMSRDPIPFDRAIKLREAKADAVTERLAREIADQIIAALRDRDEGGD